MTLKGNLAPELAKAKTILRNDSQPGTYVTFDDGRLIAVVDDENPDSWTVWLDEQPVDYITPNGIGTATELVRRLKSHTTSEFEGRGFQ